MKLKTLCTERICTIMLLPSCLVWKLLNPGNYFSFSMLIFSLCSRKLEGHFALVMVTVSFIGVFLVLFSFFFLSV